MSNTISRMGVGELTVSEWAKVPNLTSTGAVSGTTVTGSVAVTGPTLIASTTTILKDSVGDILMAQGTTVPADTTTGYAKGALFIDTDVATGTSGLYVNVGTNTSCVFKLVTNAA